MHGRSFHACIHVLYTKFFSVFFATYGEVDHSLFLAMTATMNTSIAKLLEDLNNVD